jgi:hypothetical protein
MPIRRSSDHFAGLAELTTTLPLHLSSPREYRVPMIRRRYQPQRSTASKPGLPELPGLASAIYRPEPRSQVRISNGKGVASFASSSRRSRTREDKRSKRATEDVPMRATEAEARRMHSHSLSASSSLPSLSVSFPPPMGSSHHSRSSEQGNPPASHIPGFKSALQLYETIRSSQSTTTRAHDRRSDPLLRSGPPHSTHSTLAKKQSAPARLVTARIKSGAGHQVGSMSREVATRRSNSRERGPILPAMIQRRLSRQSTPVTPAVNVGDNGDIEMLVEGSWIRSPSWNEHRSRHDFRSPRTSPSPSGIKRGRPLQSSQTEHYGRLPHRTTSPQEVLMGSYESSKAKMGIRNLLS